MRRKIRGILSALLASAVLTGALPLAATAAPPKTTPRDRVTAWAQAEAYHRGDVPGVDYYRLEKPAGAPFTLTVGNLTFKGGIIGTGQEPLSRAEINDIVKDILSGSEVQLTPQELANAQYMVNQAEAMPDWSLEDVEDALLQATGADTIIEGYRQVTGSPTMSKVEYAAKLLGYAGGKTHSANEQLGMLLTTPSNSTAIAPRITRGQAFTNKAIGAIIWASVDLAQSAGKAIAKHEEKVAAMEAALERKVLVEAFYTLAEAKIAEAQNAKPGSSTEKYMLLDGAKATATGVTFWGYGGLTSRWTADMKLIRATERDGPDGVRGIYRGEMTLTLTELLGFREAFMVQNAAMEEVEDLNKSSGGLIAGMNYVTSENVPTTLTLTATGHVEVNVTGAFAAVTGAFIQTPEFALDMELEGHAVAGNGTVQTTDVVFALRSTEIDNFTMSLVSGVTTSVAPVIGTVTVFNYYEKLPDVVIYRDMGTLLAPIDADKSVKIKMK